MIDSIPLAISILALFVSGYTWYRTYHTTLHDVAHARLTELLKINLDHPEFRDPDHISRALTSSDPKEVFAYDAFATLVWNYLEALYNVYGGKALRKSPFYGALRDLGNRHKSWLLDRERYQDYPLDLLKLLDVK